MGVIEATNEQQQIASLPVGAPRRLTLADLDDVSDLLARRCVDSEFSRWAYEPTDRDGRIGAVVRAELRLLGLTCGEAWISPAADAVAVWTFKDVAELLTDGDRSLLRRIEQDGYGTRAPDVWGRLHELRSGFHPQTAWELRWFAGESAEALRAVAAPMIARLDRARSLASAVVHHASEVESLGHLGFELQAEIGETGDCPAAWLLLRQPVAIATDVSADDDYFTAPTDNG